MMVGLTAVPHCDYFVLKGFTLLVYWKYCLATCKLSMPTLASFSLLIMLNVLSFNALSNTQATQHVNASLAHIVINDEVSQYNFANHTYYFEDTSGTMSFEEFLTQTNLPIMPKDNISLGYIKSVMWLKFTVDNQSSNRTPWYLMFDYPLLDELTIYHRTGSDNWQSFQMGDNFLFEQRPMLHRTFVTRIDPAIDVPQEYVVKIKTTSSMQIRPSILSSETFLAKELRNEMFFGISYGIMILMALYNLFLYLAVKDTSYLMYVFSVLSGSIFIMALNGHAYQYLWPMSPQLANTTLPLMTAVWMVFTALFTQMFLETKRYAPRLHMAMTAQVSFAILTVFVCLFGSYQFAIKVSTALALFNGILILSISIVCWRQGNRFARYFVGAWTVYAMGTGMLVISRFGILPDNFVTHNSAALGLLVEIIMLSLALSDKYRLLSQELEQHAQNLEEKVIRRTKELELSNQQLTTLSRSDGLTGLANRRYLDTYLENEWAKALLIKEPISILVADIDQFKSINDHFGHQYGDNCIIEVGKILKEVIHRKSDLPARFGGDEFVVILPNTNNENATALAAQVSSKVENCKLAQAPNADHAFVTLSIGCATLIPDEKKSVKSLFSLADKNLYKAKEQGRNAVVGS